MYMLMTYASIAAPFHRAMQALRHTIEQYLFCSRTIPGMYCNKHHLRNCQGWKLTNDYLYSVCQWCCSCQGHAAILLAHTSRNVQPQVQDTYLCQNISGTKPHVPVNKANHAASVTIALISDSTSCTSQRCMPRWICEAMLSTYDVQYCRTALPDASLSFQAADRSSTQAKRASLTCSGLRFSCLTAKWYTAGLGFQALGCVISIILSTYCSTHAFSRRPFVMDMLPLVMVEI